MIYAKVNEQARVVLQNAMQKTQTSKQYRRYKAVDLSSQGYDVPEIAMILDLAEATIRRLIHTVNEAGVHALQPADGQGQPVTLHWSKEQ